MRIQQLVSLGEEIPEDEAAEVRLRIARLCRRIALDLT